MVVSSAYSILSLPIKVPVIRIETHCLETPCGVLLLGSFQGHLCLCDWSPRNARSSIDKRLQSSFKADYVERDNWILKKTRAQLLDYFAGKCKRFTVPLRFAGTDFQKQVWAALQLIPYGTTISYLELARRIGKPKAVRAVAAANGANSLSIIVPCHRVIGSNGQLVGYGGGIETKKKLLQLENSFTNS